MSYYNDTMENGLYSLQLASNSNSVSVLENFVDDLVKNLSISPDVYANLMTCLNEAFTNAIYHGNKLDASKKVFINLEVLHNRRLIFTISDEGSGFDFTNIPDPTNPANIEKLTGRGVYIMKQLADQCIFNTLGNEVELHFKY